MNAITRYALAAARNNGDLNIDALIRILNEMNERQADRVIQALIGLVNIDEMFNALPAHSKADKNVVCALEHFNYLEDEVRFKYVRTDTKYFATPEDAEKYTNTGDYDWNNYKNRQEAQYVFEGNYTHEADGYCTYEKWMENAVEGF